jgi:hypothetical protein
MIHGDNIAERFGFSGESTLVLPQVLHLSDCARLTIAQGWFVSKNMRQRLIVRVQRDSRSDNTTNVLIDIGGGWALEKP